MSKKFTHPIILLIGGSLIGCQPPEQNPSTEPLTTSKSKLVFDKLAPSSAEYLSAGEATGFSTTNDAFSLRPLAIAKNFQLDGVFTSGDHLFRTPLKDIGPLLNTNTCQGCHLNDGRGVLPATPDIPFTSMLVKVGDSSGQADPVYGDQLQTFSISSFQGADIAAGLPKHNASLDGQLRGEAYAFIEYQEVTGQYANGDTFSLRQPTYKFKDLSDGQFTAGIQFSARLAPHVYGSGLLEAIPEQDIIALADPDDKDQDGISGKVSWTVDALSKQKRIGRFAYKAQTPSVLQQVAAAFNGDIGLTTSIFPKESCTNAQALCLVAASKESNVAQQPDVADTTLAFIEFYNRTLAVPARRGFDPETQSWQPEIVAGRKHFMQLGCDSCHTPQQQTGEAAGSVLGQIGLAGLSMNAQPIDVLSHQTIYPYTDLLLHDMGGSCKVSQETRSGESCTHSSSCLYVQRCDGLADGLIQGDASGSEWKTPSLWGLGLVQTVNPDSTFLHDGRARTIEEAVLWHGGEAQASQQAFIHLNKQDRADLLAFLHSL